MASDLEHKKPRDMRPAAARLFTLNHLHKQEGVLPIRYQHDLTDHASASQ